MHQKRQTRMQSIPLSYVKSNLSQVFFIIFNYKMTTGQLNIKSRTYYFYNDLINVLNFEPSNLKIDKKTWKDIDIYYIGYVDKKPDWNVNSVNPLYLIINRFYGYVSECNSIEKNVNKFLTIDKDDNVLKKYDQVFPGIKHHIKKIDDGEVNYSADYDKIKFLSDDLLPLNKLIYFPTLTVVIRCIFKENGVFYPEVYLDVALYEIQKMISYKRIDCSEGIDFYKGQNSVKCMIFNYFYFKDIGFKYQPYVCNGCHGFSMTVQVLSDFFIVTVGNIDYRVYIANVDKKTAVYISNNSVLDDKGVL